MVYLGVCLCLFFFFKQKTAYEMRISDWSSDVCSSDLLRAAAERIGFPLVVKPVMSSSGKGQSTVRDAAGIDTAWDYAAAGMRGDRLRVIAEAFIDFDYEITLLTVRHKDGVAFCPPIGHRQERGDYRESWQPAAMSDTALAAAQAMAAKVVDALGGHGIFGVEFFVKGDAVIFSELSPRPHDTGMEIGSAHV